MPKKHNKSKTSSETKASEENENENENGKNLGADAKGRPTADAEKPEKKGLCLSLDKKLKLQIRKQKKKQKKLEFEAGNKKIPTEVSEVPNIEWELATEMSPSEEVKATVLETAVRISEVDVIDDANVDLNSPEMSEEEEKSLREFLRTLEIVDGRTANQESEKEDIHSQQVKSKFQIETIPEDLFEEFIENEEMVQTRETIKAFPRTSPKHSPKPRRRDSSPVESPKPVIDPPSKLLYNYYGVSLAEPLGKTVSDEEGGEGVLVANTCRRTDQDFYFGRRLDVIVEESSDLSDASGHSEKKARWSRKDGATVFWQPQPVLRETVKIFAANEKVKDGAFADAIGGDSCSVRPVIVEKLKMSDDVVKIELAESESSEGDFEITKSETSNEAANSEVGIVDLEDGRNKSAKSEDGNLGPDKDDWSIKSISSNSTKLMEEESESWRSSSLNPELCDGAEADVESELDSQRALIFGDAGDDLSFKIPDLLESNGSEIEIFITDFKGVDSTRKASGCDSSPSGNSTRLQKRENDAENLFQKKFFAGADKSKRITQTDSESKKEAQQSNNGSTIEVSRVRSGSASKKEDTGDSSVSVKNLTQAMKDDMDKILMSKIKMMQRCPEPQALLDKTSRINLLEDIKNRKDVKSSSSETSGKQISDSSSYENVPKREKIIYTVRELPEVSQCPEALCNLAEKKVLTLPYGRLVLKKIGLGSCCSKESDSGRELDDEMYVKTGDQQPKSPPEFSFRSASGGGSTEGRVDNEEEAGTSGRTYIEFDYSNPRIGQAEKWYGMRTAVPAVLMGLSPSQKKVYEENQKRFLPDEAEAASLLDLHQKFLERRSYHEGNSRSRERDPVFDSKTMPSKVSITEISRVNKIFGKTKKPPSEVVEKAKEKQFAEKHMQSLDKTGVPPESRMMRSVGIEESQNEDGLLKSKCYGEKERGKEKSGRGTDEKEGERNTVEESEVGNSRLLAILQNAISDDFVPELNTDSSIKSGCESHEVSLVQNQGAMTEPCRGSTVKARKEDSSEKGQKRFQDIWSKEKSYCDSKGEDGGGGPRQNTRPKTICCQDETELYVKEPKFFRTVRAPGKALAEIRTGEENEKLVVTENLPAVSDVIKSFEEPKIRKPPREIADSANRKTQIQIDNEKYRISKKGDIALIQGDASDRRKNHKEKRKSMPASILSEKEIFKQKMYDEYMSKLAERIERRQQKVIKVSRSNEIECPEDTRFLDIENEFISKVKERKGKLGLGSESEDAGEQKDFLESLEKKCREFTDYWEGEISGLESGKLSGDGGTEPGSSKRSSVQLLLDTTSDVDTLPKHLQELLQVEGEEFPDFLYGVWSPAQKVSEERTEVKEESEERKKLEDEPIPPVWTPRSAQASPVLERKEFRPVNFESPTLPRKKYIQDDKRESSVPPPWQQPGGDRPPQLAKSPSSPALSLPKAPNPTVTLLQKAREGYLPRGARYLDTDMHDSPASDEAAIERLEIVSLSRNESDRPRKIEVGPKKIIGIGPTTKEGIPLVLRSEVTDENKEKWYKRMYDSLHKYGKDDDFVTVKYRTSPSRKGLYGYHGSSSGYQSEPESLNYDRSANKYVTLDRRRQEKSKENECISVTLPRSRASPPRRDFVGYKNQPGRIEDYEPGRSSISELEANKWWDEVLEIFDRWLDREPEARDEAACSIPPSDAVRSRREEEKSRPIRKSQSPRSFTNYASGYISDPQYVYKRSEEELQSPPSSEEQKEAYRIIQKGGEIPLKGLRKPAPERPKDSLDTEIEYFPLSPTLTRIRVHKQNITPLSEFPFYFYPISCQQTTLNYPTLPFGVCSSFSQVQIFPPPLLPQISVGEGGSEASCTAARGRDQKFSVQLQNISGPRNYVQIVPKPRSHPKKPPIYANIPVRERSCSPEPSTLGGPTSSSLKRDADEQFRVDRIACEEVPSNIGFATFSDLKRIVPSINSASLSKIPLSKIPGKPIQRKSELSPGKLAKETLKKKECLVSTFAGKIPARSKKTDSTSRADKTQKKERKKILPNKAEAAKKNSKTKVPLSESLQREKPLSKTNKRLKNLSENLKKKKLEPKKEPNSAPTKDLTSASDANEDVIEYLSRFVEYESETSYVDLKTAEDLKPQVTFEDTENEEDASMSPVYESVHQDGGARPKVGADMTDVFRSRSFSPDVRRKIFKLPDMNKPVPPKRKQSKNSPTLKMWSKMMVSYPNHRSRLDAFDSNVKFLRDRIKRKLAEKKESKTEFGDDVETVRTIKKDKNGAMSIKTNRYVRVSRPASSGSYPDVERRRLTSEQKTKISTSDASKPRKYSDASTVGRAAGSDVKKPDTFVKSSTTYSVRNPARLEEDKRKSVEVTVAISSKGKELLRKTAGLTSPPKKPTVAKNSSSPCPSVSSYRSGYSGKSPASDKGSTTSSQDRLQSPQTRFFSPNSSMSRLSSPSRSTSPGSAIARQRTQKSNSKPGSRQSVAPPVLLTCGATKPKPEAKRTMAKAKDVSEMPTVTKFPGKRLLSQVTILGKQDASKDEIKKKVKKNGKAETGPNGRFKKNGSGKGKAITRKENPESRQQAPEKPKNEVLEGRDLVRTDSFFQNLFLRGSPDNKRSARVERTSSVLERARRYQRMINWPETYKSEPSLSLVTFYLNQKRPVSFSKFKCLDGEFDSSRSHSPLGSLHSETFQMKLRRFDSMSQFGDGLCRDFSPEAKERSSSEPPLHRSHANSPEQGREGKSSRTTLSEASSMRSSPNSSRSPSCRRIQSLKSALKALEGGRDFRNFASRARSAGEIEDVKFRSDLQFGELGKSVSSLNLSNVSDHTEYQAYVLELMHSTRKCERFRELHKFYSNLERMGKLEKTASTGDLRPRLRNEDIIDFDRWKKVRTKERAEAELKTLVDGLVKVQKEKDLLFRAADVEAVRWKGDRGLRIKERSVEDLKEQFSKRSREDLGPELWKKELDARKDHYKPLWRGSSIADVATNLNNALVSHRGRPLTLEEWESIEKANARIGKEYGYSLKAWSSLSSEQVDALKDQLSEIYAHDARRRPLDGTSDFPEAYEISVPKDSGIKSPGESSLHVRCSSALSKSQTYTPTVKRKEDLRKAWRKAESVSALPCWKTESEEKVCLPQLPWKDEASGSRLARSHSEGRSAVNARRPVLRSKSVSSAKPLSENEKKRLSMTLSREVIEKMSKASGKGPLYPRETLGALAVAGGNFRERSPASSKTSDDKSRRDFVTALPPKEKKMEAQRWQNAEHEDVEPANITKTISITELESGSGSSETSTRTVIRKNSMDVLKKVQYFEELQQGADDFESEPRIETSEARTPGPIVTPSDLQPESGLGKVKRSTKEKTKTVLIPSSSVENLHDYFGQQKQYATSSLPSKPKASKTLSEIPSRSEDFYELRNVFDGKKWAPVRYRSSSPVVLRNAPSGSSNESLFSYRSRSVSPDPTKYYRAYLKMVKCGAVRRLCNKFESWEDLLSMSSDKDFWLPPPPRRFASDPELTRDLLRRFGTDPTKVTIRGQEVGDVRWLRTKFEKDLHPSRARGRLRRVRSPLARSPLTVADRFMPRINVISKTAELQMQASAPDARNLRTEQNVSASGGLDGSLASPEGYRSLIDYTNDHGGYYYTGEVEKLRRKFERLQEAEKLSILGQMYTSAPDVNELRDIAPYLECSWVAHRHPGVSKTVSSPELQARRREAQKKSRPKPRPHSSSPVRPKQPSSILKPSHSQPHRSVFADQKFDPSIHRPKYRYQPEREIERRYKRGDPDWWRHWNKPTVTFKESVSFDLEPELRDLMNLDSPRKYVESEVTIHYKSPVRSEAKAALSEDELARRQAESMKRIYKEERRRKYLQELQDMNSRRHTDNFTPSQKSPISLNRYDDFPLEPSAFCTKARDYSTDPVLVARGLYDFVGRRPRELAFRRGDIIFIIRKLDKNWCEGELNGVVGLFPLSYVEVIPYNEINLRFGRARAKYDFVPQTSMELSAHKGDMITLIRKIDENWFEGRIGDRTGIIPASYCHVLAAPQATRLPVRVEKASKPVAAPAAHSLIHNGTGLSSKHYYAPYLSGPNSPGRSTVSSASATYHDGHPSADALIDEALMQLDEEFDIKRSATKSAAQPLSVRINPRPEPALYQVLFNHVPNNDDELELTQGETVTVVEKCGDGWYIGSKTSDGKLGIFPGTHVRRIGPEFV